MTKNPKTYLLVFLLISSVLLFMVNFYTDLAITKYIEYLKIASRLLLLLTFASVGLYLFKRTLRTFRISTSITLAFFTVNLALVKEVISLEIYKSEFQRIEKQLANCETAIIQFEKDLKDSDLKYFTFGMGEDTEYRERLEKDYNLKVYYMGCIIHPSYQCYNNRVDQELGIKIK